MSKMLRLSIALPPGLAALALGVLLTAALPARSASAEDYPKGLFENSPVVPQGQQQYEGAPDSLGPDASAPPEYDAPPGPDALPPPDGPPGRFAPGLPEAEAFPPDYCLGIASRTFSSLEEVRRAHARCGHARRGPPPLPGY